MTASRSRFGRAAIHARIVARVRRLLTRSRARRANRRYTRWGGISARRRRIRAFSRARSPADAPVRGFDSSRWTMAAALWSLTCSASASAYRSGWVPWTYSCRNSRDSRCSAAPEWNSRCPVEEIAALANSSRSSQASRSA
ncbi:hypothetical protein HFP72_01010 [Nocardiopsis sp. ARC36]